MFDPASNNSRLLRSVINKRVKRFFSISLYRALLRLVLSFDCVHRMIVSSQNHCATGESFFCFGRRHNDDDNGKGLIGQAIYFDLCESPCTESTLASILIGISPVVGRSLQHCIYFQLQRLRRARRWNELVVCKYFFFVALCLARCTCVTYRESGFVSTSR